MIEKKIPKWLKIAREIQQLAQTGLSICSYRL